MVSCVVSYLLVPSICTDSRVLSQWWSGHYQNHNKTPAHCGEKITSLLHRCLFLILARQKVRARPYLLPPTPLLMLLCRTSNLIVTSWPHLFSCLPSFLISLYLFFTCSVLFWHVSVFFSLPLWVVVLLPFFFLISAPLLAVSPLSSSISSPLSV